MLDFSNFFGGSSHTCNLGVSLDWGNCVDWKQTVTLMSIMNMKDRIIILEGKLWEIQHANELDGLNSK